MSLFLSFFLNELVLSFFQAWLPFDPISLSTVPPFLSLGHVFYCNMLVIALDDV